MNADTLKFVLKAEFDAHFNTTPKLAPLLDDIARLISDAKYFLVAGRVYKKRTSVSVGEQIATAAANLLRDKATSKTRARFSNQLQFWGGYVDDCLACWQGSRVLLNKFIRLMKSSSSSPSRTQRGRRTFLI